MKQQKKFYKNISRPNAATAGATKKGSARRHEDKVTNVTKLFTAAFYNFYYKL
jgi:hypothetical protein